MNTLEPPSESHPGRGRNPERRILLAAGAVDAETVLAPAAMVVEGGRVVAVGTPEAIGGAGGPPREDLGNVLLMPPLVNAHTHLDLTNVGPVPLERGFDAWLDQIRRRRPDSDAATNDAVDAGIRASLAGGVVAVGDIAGDFGLQSARRLSASSMAGISFIELFGIGRRLSRGLQGLKRMQSAIEQEELSRPGFKVGLSPHAPYSCGSDLYAAAAASGLPVSTHLAETPEEAQLLRTGEGPLLDLLRSIGAFEPDAHPARGAAGEFHSGIHPVDMIGGLEPRRPWLLAHLNYPVEPDEPPSRFQQRAAMLRDRGATIVYCPRAARFLGHPRSGRDSHPWRLLRDAGVAVVLGTDGMPCLDTPERITPLDDLRLILGEGLSLPEGLGMVTTEAARGLGLRSDAVVFSGGCGAGLLSLPLSEDVQVGGPGDLARSMVAAGSSPSWIQAADPTALDADFVG